MHKAIHVGAAAAKSVSAADLPSAIVTARKLPECPRFKELFGDDFRVMDTYGKGSCFFHALAAAICAGYDRVKDKKVRESIGLSLRDSMCDYANQQLYNDTVQYVQRKYEQYSRDPTRATPSKPDIPPFREFKQRLKNSSVWADLVMISFVAFTYGYNLLFWSDADCAFYYGCDMLDCKQQLATVLILWHAHSHFELIIRVGKDGTVQRQFHWPKDAVLLNRLEKEYNRGGTK
jgi:hypothetical protein